MEEGDPPVDADFEVDSEAMDVVSFTFPFAMSCEAHLFESIPMPMLLGCACVSDFQRDFQRSKLYSGSVHQN